MNFERDIRKELWQRQQISSSNIDYNAWHQKRALLRQVSEVSNTCLFAVDTLKQRYDFASQGFASTFGYKRDWLDTIEEQEDFMEQMTHPLDFAEIVAMQVAHAHFIYSLPPCERNNYSTTYSFRMRNEQGCYLNVLSTQRVVHTDTKGNAWIVLGQVTLLPNQHTTEGVRMLITNLKTGQITNPAPSTPTEAMLTSRELEVLTLIEKGYLSKQIAERLFISLNTVSNHRKSILRKLCATTSTEAVSIAMRIGVLPKS